MLQFWKKPNDKRKNDDCLTQKNADNATSQTTSSKKGTELNFEFCDNIIDTDELESRRDCSRLLNTLQNVLLDKKALDFFMQYMESRNALPYVLCWLNIESFKCDLFQCKKLFIPVLDDLTSKSKSDNSIIDTNDCKTSMGNLDKIASILNENNAQNIVEIKIFNQNMNNEVNCGLSREDKVKQHIINNGLIIFKKFLCNEAVYSLDYPNYMRNNVLENICQPDKVINGDCFDEVQEYIYKIMEKYFETFLGTSYYCKYQIDILTSGNVALEDVIHNETALFYFMEFLEQKNCRNLLDFWIAATNLQQQFNDQKDFFDPIEAQTDAVVLYDKYFSLQAHCPLGLGDRVRFIVEQNICGENGLNRNCFQMPLKLVETILERNFLKTFLDSHLYYKFLSELINTVQSNDCLRSIEIDKNSASSCSSEKSFNTNMTFLALEMTDNGSRKNKSKRANMNIDTKDLCDPDSLWKRKHHHSLSCGRITPMGKFETDLDPEPDKKEFTFKNAVRKIVQEDKRKEEMAWQVAEKIVRDVTDMTLNQKKPNLFCN